MISNYKQQLKEKGELYLLCKVFPASSETAFKAVGQGNVSGQETEFLEIRIKAPANKGQANKAVLKFLEKNFKAEAKIVSGASSRFKLVKLKI